MWWGAGPRRRASTQSPLEDARQKQRWGRRSEERQAQRGGERGKRMKDIVQFLFSFFPPSSIPHWANPPKAIVRGLGSVACRRKVGGLSLEAKRQHLEQGLHAQKELTRRRSAEPVQVMRMLSGRKGARTQQPGGGESGIGRGGRSRQGQRALETRIKSVDFITSVMGSRGSVPTRAIT